MSGARVLELECALESPGRLVKAQVPGATTRVSDSVGQRWGQRICILNKFPVDVMLLVQGHSLRTTGRRKEGWKDEGEFGRREGRK